MAPHQYVIIVGCGRLGAMLANQLSGRGGSVVVVDCDEAAFKHLSAEFSGFQVTGNAAELAVLRQAKIEKADCLFATTQYDNVNLMVAQVAKTIFGVPKVIARIFDPQRESVYGQFGIETICPTRLSAQAFLNALRDQPESEQP
ncbi:MAG TPA: TrkA family potassium uptake protein [Anaerolineae bacterium]|nr:TrkA family potassium uptake protein [Anaerolineae bacterium]